MAIFRPSASATGGNLKTGFGKVVKRLDYELNKIKNGTNKGLLLAAIQVRRDMETTVPTIPIDFGNLRASWFIITKSSAPANLRTLEIKGGNFNAAAPTGVLAKLQTGHPQVLQEMHGEMGKFPIAVAMGFSAFYAAAVHEKVGDINWSKEGSGAKYFQAALYRNIPEITKIIKANAMVKP